MLDPKKLRDKLQTLLADDVKDLSDDQSPSFHLQADATVPVGPAAVKVEVGVRVEDGEIKHLEASGRPRCRRRWIGPAAVKVEVSQNSKPN